MTNKEEIQKIINHHEKRDEFVTDADNYVYWWPEGSKGHLAAVHLRVLADELDRRNTEWDKQVNEYFDKQ
jgi:hypothetical protein